jgi:hypothetical protein
MKPIRHITDPNLIAVAHLVKALSQGATAKQMVEASGLNVATCNRYAAALHQVGMAHIERLLPDSRGLYKTRVWRLGPGEDATHPAPRSRASRAKEQRRKASVTTTRKATVVLTMTDSLLRGTPRTLYTEGYEKHASR